MSLKGLARDTLEIIENGLYEAPSGRIVSIDYMQEDAVNGTRLYTPGQLNKLFRKEHPTTDLPSFEVTAEKTGDCARRVYAETLAADGSASVVALNYASAKNPGGGFITGARAQEEDLTRCSGLYPCLLTQREYYDVNRANKSMLYTDHMIYSPDVPFFRDDSYKLLDEAVPVSIITAPAPNAGQALRRDPSALPDIEETLERRAGHVLALAEDQGHRVLVLGAWGCGVFRNEPAMMARIFKKWLTSDRFRGAFDRVVFGVYTGKKQVRTREAFEEVFGG